MAFQKATKRQAKGRLALVGPSGSGKTYTALRVAKALAPNGRIAVIDSEHGSASKYADRFDFDVCELTSFSPQNYVDAIHEAEKAGYEVIVADSISHAWEGKGGALDMKDAAARRSKSGNSFTAWREITPIHNRFVESMIGSPAHIIATMRAKTEYVMEENEKGKKTPRKVGMAPIQRAGMEYEFDVVCDLDHELHCVVSKTRCPDLESKDFQKAGEDDLGATFYAWLTSGEAALPPVSPAPPEEPEAVSPGARVLDHMRARCAELNVEPGTYAAGALNSILRKLDIAKNILTIAAREDDINAAIDAWQPPTEEAGDEFVNGPPVGSEVKAQTFADNPARLRGLHARVGEELGYRKKNEAHDLIHRALPEGFESLSDLPTNREEELWIRMREIACEEAA